MFFNPQLIFACNGTINNQILCPQVKTKRRFKKNSRLFLKEKNSKATGMVTCVGSLTDANIRFANQTMGKLKKAHFETVSLTGVLSTYGSHLHISIAAEEGKTLGGHLLDGCLIYTTAELIITELIDLEFKREADSTFGYKELVIDEGYKI